MALCGFSKDVFCYINYVFLSLSYLVWGGGCFLSRAKGVAEDENKMPAQQDRPCSIRNRVFFLGLLMLFCA